MLDMLSSQPKPVEPPAADDSPAKAADRPTRSKFLPMWKAERGPFDLVFAVGASLALWALIALIVVVLLF
ncbi:MAG: hypothetical protein AB7P23_02205 [Amphiplicatus sp.]